MDSTNKEAESPEEVNKKIEYSVTGQLWVG